MTLRVANLYLTILASVCLAFPAQAQSKLDKLSIPVGAIAQDDVAPTSEAVMPGSPILGTWALDLSSMPGDYGSLPRSVTYTFAEDADGAWSTVIDIVAPDDSVRHMTSRFTLDGVAVVIEGDQLEADAVAASLPSPDTLVMGLSKEGRPGSVRVYTVSPDGNELTESAANVGDDGMPFVRTFRFVRVRN